MNREQRRQAERDARKSVADEAVEIAKDVAAGRLNPFDMEGELLAEMRKLFAFVDGPDDPLWEIQMGVARGILGLDGIPYNELCEWAAVHKDRPAGEAPVRTVDWDAVQERIVASIRADLLIGQHTPDFSLSEYFLTGVKDSVAEGVRVYVERPRAPKPLEPGWIEHTLEQLAGDDDDE